MIKETLETIETVKDIIETLNIPSNDKLMLQRLVSNIRTEMLCLDRDVLNHSVRAKVYGEVVDLILNRLDKS